MAAMANPEVANGRVEAVDRTSLGTALCFFAAVVYAVTNVCLRQLSVSADLILSVGVKETVAVMCVGPWLVLAACRGNRPFPNARAFWTLAGSGMATQLGGNVTVVWAMGVIGLSITVPLMVCTNLVGSALLGRLWLGERVSLRSMLAIAVLMVAVALLSLGAGGAEATLATLTQRAGGPMHALLAVGGTLFAGCCFSLLNVSIRYNCSLGTPTPTIVAMTTGMATVTLLPCSLVRLGPAGIAATPAPSLGIMVLAGFLNLVAFFSYSRGLRWINVVRANLVNATQTALAAVAGILFFAEQLSITLLAGLALTIVGMLLMDKVETETSEL